MQNENNDKPGKDGKFPDERNKGKKISRRDALFVEHLLQGKSIAQAARDAGYRPTVANGKASTWVRESKSESKKPHLWEYYQERRKISLRLFDVTIENIVNELKIISFATLDKFIHFPTRAELEAAELAEAISDAVNKKVIGLELTENDQKLIDLRDTEKKIRDYRPGSFIKLKCIEDIPKDLIPAIAEIAETKEGIKIKLFSKLDAIEKLAKYLKMFDDARSAEGGSLHVQEINIIVNGTKSPLMQIDPKDKAA